MKGEAKRGGNINKVLKGEERHTGKETRRDAKREGKGGETRGERR